MGVFEDHCVLRYLKRVIRVIQLYDSLQGHDDKLDMSVQCNNDTLFISKSLVNMILLFQK